MPVDQKNLGKEGAHSIEGWISDAAQELDEWVVGAGIKPRDQHPDEDHIAVDRDETNEEPLTSVKKPPKSNTIISCASGRPRAEDRRAEAQ